MFAILPIAWTMVNIPPGVKSHETLFTLHKSIGVSIFALAAIRLVVRACSPSPAKPDGLPWIVTIMATASHWLLYAVLIAMPVSGYIFSSAGGYLVSYFGIFTLPALPRDPALAHVSLRIHLTLQWAIYVLLSLHVLAAVWHIAIRRDGILNRMLPKQNTPNAETDH